VVTHPYEGGHPDHDAAAFVTCMRCGSRGKRETPLLAMEMTSYHGVGGKLTVGAFLGEPSVRESAGRANSA